MNAPLALAVAVTLGVAGVGPFLAVHVGGKMFDPKKHDEPTRPNDDTMQLPRVTDEADPYSSEKPMKGHTMVKMIKVYEDGDLLTSDEAADHFGYTRDYFCSLLMMSNKAADPRLIRLRIETDAAWRRQHRSRAQYVFEYSTLKAWYMQRQNRPAVKAKASRRTKSASPIL